MKQSTKLGIVAALAAITAISIDWYLIEAGMAWRIACTVGALLGFGVGALGAWTVTK